MIGPIDDLIDDRLGRVTDSSLTRRELVVLAATAAASVFGSALLSDGARADAALGSLDVSGDSVTTDNGQLRSLTVSIDAGHLSYDGLDTPAASVDVNLFAALAGGDTDATNNRIATTSYTVADESALETNAGSVDFTFDSVDVLAARDVRKADFRASTDGGTADTDVDFRLEVVVRNGGDAPLVEAEDTATATISVTNQARSEGVQGTGSTNAGGKNQRP